MEIVLLLALDQKEINAEDQKSIIATPKIAFKNGATSIVIGRSITKGNIKKNIQKLIKSLK